MNSHYEYRCQECQSLDVLLQSWIDPNTREVVGAEEDFGLCSECNGQTTIVCHEVITPMMELVK